MTTIRNRPHQRGRGVLAMAAAAALVVSGAIGASMSQSVAHAAPPEPGIANIVDTSATPETKSLWSYLNGTRGEGVLFGHQGDLDNGVTFSTPDGVKSDVHAGTGDYPAIMGIDTLSLEGSVGPGKPTNTDAQNVAAVANGIKQAHSVGAIVTFSTHINNFVTGGSFSDSSGRVVSHILPGGDKNATFNAYLDRIAATADASVDAEGNLIPIIFRPFHENTGSWFWWGAAQTTAGEYKELFRYTVEYLRDTKGVSNFLYAFSPNGTFAGDSSLYLATYPGDEWVDVMGYDRYEGNNDAADSDAWIAGTLVDLRMLSDLADEHGKIAAFTEFGRNGERTIKETGNKSLNFYSDLLTAMKNDPKAKRMAYMLTWQNWGMDQFYVPYPAFGSTPEHEMFPDFKAMYDDPYSVFASNIPSDALTRDVEAAPAQPTLRLVSPADGVRVTTPSVTVRAKATVKVPTRAWFTVSGDAVEHELTLGADGYHSAVWNIGEDGLTNATVQVTVHATYATGDPMEAVASIVLGSTPELPVGTIDDFEGYGDDNALRAAYSFNNTPSSALTLGAGAAGSQGVGYAYDFTAQEYQGFGKVLGSGQDWSAFNRFNLWLDPDGSNQKLVLQMKAGGQTFEYYPSLAGTEPQNLSIHFSDFRPPPWDSANKDKRLTTELMKSVTEFYVYINKADAYTTPGSIGLDNLMAVAGEGGPLPGGPTTSPSPSPSPSGTVTSPAPAGSVGIDNFESYVDDAALQTAWNRRNNQSDLSLVAPISGTGTNAMKFAFDFSSVTYAGIARSLTADWSGYDNISGWILPDGSNQQVVMQFKAGDVSYEVYASSTGTQAVEFALPLADAVPASYQNLDPARRPSAEELKSVTEFAIFITKASDTKVTGAIVLDDLKVTRDAGPEPTPSASASPTSTGTATSSPTATASSTSLPTTTATVTVTATPPSSGDVYTTPGYHSVNGRKWFTTCESYSVTWRCTTEIWATQVTHAGGKFV
ncbi:MAG: glycosyl hydrolase, partial [Arachnia sp.]